MLVGAVVDLVICLDKVSQKNEILRSKVGKFLEKRFPLGELVASFSTLKCGPIKAVILKYINAMFFKKSQMKKVLGMLQANEQILRNYSKFSKVEFCQAFLGESEGVIEANSRMVYEFYTILSLEMIRDIEMLESLKLRQKEYFFQKLRFLRKMMIYGLTSQPKNKGVKGFILGICSEIIRFNFKHIRELTNSSGFPLQKASQAVNASVKTNLRILNCCLDILKIVQQFSIYYKKNHLLQTFNDNKNNVALFQRKTSRLFYGVESKTETVKSEIGITDSPKIKETSLQSIRAMQEKRNSIAEVYSGKGKRSSINLKFDGKRPFKHLFLSLGQFLVQLKKELVEEMDRLVHSRESSDFQEMLSQTEASLESCVSLQLGKLEMSKQLLAFFKVIKNQRSISSGNSCIEIGNNQPEEGKKRISHLGREANIYDQDFLKIGEFLRSNLVRLKVSYESKVEFKKEQTSLRHSNYLNVIDFLAIKSKETNIPEELVKNYLVVTNYFVFLNAKNSLALEKNFAHFFLWTEEKYACNIILQLAHFTQSLELLTQIVQTAAEAFLAYDSAFVKNIGFTYHRADANETATEHTTENELTVQRVLNVLELMTNLSNEANTHTKSVAECLYGVLKKSEIFRQVSTLDVLSDYEAAKSQTRGLSHDSVQVCVKTLQLIRVLASQSTVVSEFFKKSCSGKIVEVFMNSRVSEVSIRCALLYLYFELYAKSDLLSFSSFLNDSLVLTIQHFAEELKRNVDELGGMGRTTRLNKREKRVRKTRVFYLMDQLYSQEFSQSNGVLLLIFSCLKSVQSNVIKDGCTQNNKLGNQEFISNDKQGVMANKLKPSLHEIFTAYNDFVSAHEGFNDFWKFQFVSFFYSIEQMLDDFSSTSDNSKLHIKEKAQTDDNEKNMFIDNLKGRENEYPEYSCHQNEFTKFCLKIMQHVKSEHKNLEFMLTELFLNESLTFDEKILFLYHKANFEKTTDDQTTILIRFKKSDFFMRNREVSNHSHLFLLFAHELLSTISRETCKNHVFNFESKFPIRNLNYIEEEKVTKEEKSFTKIYDSVKRGAKFNSERIKFLSILRDDFMEGIARDKNRFCEMFVCFYKINRIKSQNEHSVLFQRFFLKLLKEINAIINETKGNKEKKEIPTISGINNEQVTQIVSFYLQNTKDVKIRFMCVKILVCVMKSKVQHEEICTNTTEAKYFRENDINVLDPILEDVVKSTFAEFYESILQKHNQNFEIMDFVNFKKGKNNQKVNRISTILSLLSNYLSISQGPTRQKTKKCSETQIISAKLSQNVFQLFFRLLSNLTKNHSLLFYSGPSIPEKLEKIISSVYKVVGKILNQGKSARKNLKGILKLVFSAFDKLETVDVEELKNDELKCFYLFILLKVFRFLIIQADESKSNLQQFVKYQDLKSIVGFSQKVYLAIIIPKKKQWQEELYCELVHSKHSEKKCKSSKCLEEKLTKNEYFLNEIMSITFSVCRLFGKKSIKGILDESNFGNTGKTETISGSFFAHFEKLETSIELCLDKRAFEFFFKMPRICSETSDHALFLFGQNLLTATTNLEYFTVYSSVNEVLRKMFQMDYINKKIIVRFYTRHRRFFDFISFFFVIFINLLMLLTLGRSATDGSVEYTKIGVLRVISLNGGLLALYMIVAVLILTFGLFQLVMVLHVDYAKCMNFESKTFLEEKIDLRNEDALQDKKTDSLKPLQARIFPQISVYFQQLYAKNVILRMLSAFFTNGSFYYLLYFVIAFLGFINPFFWAIMLLDVIRIFNGMRKVAISLWANVLGFLNLLLLCIVLLFVYACTYFAFLGEQSLLQDGGTDSTAFSSLKFTFLNAIYYGLRYQGGLGQHLSEISPGEPDYYSRFVIDMLFFFIVSVFLVSSFYALIIDSYFSLRKKKREGKSMNGEFCCICHQSQIQIKNKGEEWGHHLEEVHNLKRYFHFFLYLHLNRDMYQVGNSKTIKEMVANRDFSFMPFFRKG